MTQREKPTALPSGKTPSVEALQDMAWLHCGSQLSPFGNSLVISNSRGQISIISIMGCWKAKWITPWINMRKLDLPGFMI